MKHQLILILDFGGQHNQLIARRVRGENVYCEVHPYTLSPEEICGLQPAGMILVGGGGDLPADISPRVAETFRLGIPVLGIGQGAVLMARLLGGTAETKEGGGDKAAKLAPASGSVLLKGFPEKSAVWLNGSGRIIAAPEGFAVTASAEDCPAAVIENAGKNLYAVQFHPEISHTDFGKQLLRNFLFDICNCEGGWSMANFLERSVAEIRAQVGNRSVLCAMSGGVDSSVCASLVSRAVGRQLTCIFVDTGLMRKNEGDEVEAVFRENFDSRFVRVQAEQRFLGKLKGVTDPERKRKIIGEEFIRVFEEEAGKVGRVDFLVQGTIYPDVIESGIGDSAVIKSHHNVGGLPDVVDFQGLIEPLRLLFKDEVRELGEALDLPEHIVWRQPFPGPGLAIRCIGEVTAPRLDRLREADAIFREEIKNAGLDRTINQYFAVMTDMRSVGMTGDRRTYDCAIALRSVITGDFMTADWAKIPYALLEKVSGRILHEVDGVNRIVYDITGKPPATIEWE